jgi:predicted RNase H-like HicB family nuclease
MFTFTGIIVKEDIGYSSLCPELDVASDGDSPESAKAMLLEAATLHLEGAFEDGLPYSRPIPPTEDPRQAARETVIEVFRFTVDVSVHANAQTSLA